MGHASVYCFLTQLNVWLARNVFLFKRREHRIVLDFLSPSDHDCVLDYGCNTGYLSRMIKDEFGCEVSGCDINPCALAVARRKYPDIPFYLCAGSFFRKKYDKVLVSHVLEHVDDPMLLLKDVRRVLRKGGVAVFSIPQERVRGEMSASQIIFSALKGRPENPHKRKISLSSLVSYLEAAGFHIQRHRYVTLLPPFDSGDYRWLSSLSLVVLATVP